MSLDVKTIVSHFSISAERYSKNRKLPDHNDLFVRSFQNRATESLKILDVGCGTGHRLKGLGLYYLSFDLVGIDITPKMLKQGQTVDQSNLVTFLVGDSLHIPFADHSFDAVIISEVLHHLVTDDRQQSCLRREQGLRELLRLVKPDGLILLHEVCFYSAWRTMALFHLSYLFSRFNLSIPSLNIHKNVVVNFFTVSELEEMFKRMKLQVLAKESKIFKKPVNWITGLFSFPVWSKYVLSPSFSHHLVDNQQT
ncbi:MAG TPA: class I SAM-dependent methyltransferase [Anaerolineae bacterium]|nr:class I SAM-dependent methyltransferase [Anaerolineae bacterium]